MGPIAQGAAALYNGAKAAGGEAVAGANAVKNLGDGTFTQYDNQSTATNAAPESAAIGVDSVQALPASNQKANIGIDQAAKIESEIGTPVGNEVKNTGLDTNRQTSDLISQTKNDYQQAVQGAIQATQNAEAALNKAAENAKINPQEYLETLGVGGKLMSAIGMVLSGIGSGVTGQPNLAMQMYQKNMDAAIQAQALKFKNLMEVSAQKQGLIKTAQDKQQIAANAYNAAVMSVSTGANVAIQGAMTQIKSASAVPLAGLLQNQNNMLNSQAIDSHSKQFSSTIQSGDAGKTTLMGQGLQPVVDYLSGKPRPAASKGVTVDKRVGRPLPTSVDPNGEVLNPSSDKNFDRDLMIRKQQQKLQEDAIMQGGGDPAFSPGNGAYPKANDALGQKFFEGDSNKSRPKPFLDKYGDGK